VGDSKDSEGGARKAVDLAGAASSALGDVISTPDGGDCAVVIGRLYDDGLAVIRKRGVDAPLEAGIVRPLRDGQPIHGEVVKLTPRADSGALCVCDVAVHHDGRRGTVATAAQSATDAVEAPDLSLARKGPAKISSPRFRDGWELVFGRPGDDDLPN
jgi:hypothetical protein